jgi:DtxR family Mn-dependent transcriptional regulator
MIKEIYFIIIGFILGILFYPTIKYFIKYYLLNKTVSNKKIEQDILKEIYQSNKENKILTIDILNKKINIPTSKLLEVLDRLVNLNYIYLTDNDLRLTNKGKEEAQNIISKHRLLERYLFEKTSADLKKIHKIADENEHTFDEEKIQNIKNELSNPCIDQHGDILNENIYITKRLANLSNCEVNEIYIVKHIEDEPLEIYEYLVNLDLAPFDKIKILEIDKNYIKIINDKGKIIELPYLLANNVFIEKIKKNEKLINYFEFLLKSNVISLDKLKINDIGLITGLSFYIRGIQRQRLMELGFIKGNIVIPLYNNSLSSDPKAYKINNSIISLRKEQALKIYVINLSNLNNIDQKEIKELINV